MSLSRPLPSKRKGFSLTIIFSVILVSAVVIPLIITVISSELILRPTLLSQATTEMQTDAQSHTASIDTLLTSRLEALGSLSQFVAIQRYLAGGNTYVTQAANELSLGYHMDANYAYWALFDSTGKFKLSYPEKIANAEQLQIPADVLQKLLSTHHSQISDVYYDDQSHQAFINLFSPILSNATPTTVLGIGRSTLTLNEIWTAVDNETNAAPGSYAMIIDGHGVRIGYTNTDTTFTTLPPAMFKAVAPLTSQFQQQVKTQNLYGNSITPVTVLTDPKLANIADKTQNNTSFSFTPALKNEDFQAFRSTASVVPWTYIVLRPTSTITGAASLQNIYLVLIAAVASLLAAIIGIFVGRGITQPILRSVSSLRENSKMLKSLAAREQVTATEQQWIVESSQTGLQSVQYYAEATGIAARKMAEVGNDLSHNWNRYDAHYMQQRLDEIISTAQYIEKATTHQERSSSSLATAIQVNTQVTEQLVSGATSAAGAADQLEQVIEQLRQVVGE